MQFLKRLSPSIAPLQNSTANTIYVDKETEEVKVGTGSSGTSERTLLSSGAGADLTFNSLTTTDYISIGTQLLLGPTNTGLTVPSDGVIRMFDDSGTSFARLEFGGSTAAHVALRASGTILDAVLGDVSAYTTFRALEFTSQNATYLMRSGVAWTNFAAAQTGTLTNAPSAGNPTKWIAVDDAGTPLFIPAWTA